MSVKPETVFRKRLVIKLKLIPRITVFSIQQIAIRGTPDLFICVNGYFVALELKKDKASKPSALQTYNIKNITDAGGVAMVCYPENETEVLNLIRSLSETTTNTGVQKNDRI